MGDGLASALKRIIAAEARCKAVNTCERLTVRELFFEPNPYTLETWRREHGFYEAGIDTRVVFVCESPSDRRSRDDDPEFEVKGQKGWTCWNYTAQDKRFREARVRHGFQHCFVTNAVKCGKPKPSTPAKLTPKEAADCSVHLAAELHVVRPVVIACLGENALRIVLEHAAQAGVYTVTCCPHALLFARGIQGPAAAMGGGVRSSEVGIGGEGGFSRHPGLDAAVDRERRAYLLAL